MTAKARVATAWMGGCSGCHMSFLDLDERLIELAAKLDLVFSPVVDIKEFPENGDVCLVEGAVCNEEHLHQIQVIRARTKILVSFGDCAVNGNVTAMRNVLGNADSVLQRAYIENVTLKPQLLDRVRPVHEVVPVDVFLPGCPPSADIIYFALCELLAGRQPDLTGRLIYG